MLDIETLVWERFTALPGVHVASEMDTRSIVFPAIIYSISGEGQVGNGPDIWRLSLEANVLVRASEYSTVGRVYDEIRSWAGQRSPSGHITRVTDVSLFSRVSRADVQDKTIHQYTGAFAIIARS